MIYIYIFIIFIGQGEAWIDDCKFETVDPNKVKTTEVITLSKSKPKNLIVQIIQ
jgi:hypothetical protein